MLISPPFLPAPTAGESDEAYLNRAMLCGEPGDGFFPISFDLNWHGGTHLRAPSVSGKVLPVRAIADGKLAYFRVPTPVDTAENAPLNYGGWTDNGCIVLRHETEIGEGESSKVVFYSIYMHLSKISLVNPKVDMRVYRKDIVGESGKIYGVPDKIHFEIIADDTQIPHFFGRTERELTYQTKAGRTDSCWGDMHFYLPPEVIGYSQPAAKWTDQNSAGDCLARPPEDLFVRMHYEKGQCVLSTYTLDGKCIGEHKESDGFEYDLFEIAGSRYPACPSAGYEMLRFGRILGPDSLAPANAAHWRQVALPTGVAWFNLNASTVTCFSDADFPHWLGWKLIDDDTDEDSHCQSPYLRTLLKLDEDPLFHPSRSIVEISKSPDFKHAPVKPEEEHVYSKSFRIKKHNQEIIEKEESRKLLGKCIFKFPSEWGRESFDTRYGWLLKESELGPAMPENDYEQLKNHQQAMAFWEDAVLKDIKSKHWHFPPKEFIQAFRKCGWLSQKEIVQLVPTSALRKKDGVLVSEDVAVDGVSRQNIVRLQVPLNKALQKYLIATNTLRMSAFFGNSTQETLWLRSLHENNKNTRYFPWDGRGLLQLTWPANYMKYWKFRGRAVSALLEKSLNAAHKQAESTGKNTALADSELISKGLTAEIIRWRDDVEVKVIDATQSAGAYWAWTQAAKLADKHPEMKRIVEKVGASQYIYYSCDVFGQVAATVNFGSPVHDLKRIGSVNGIFARNQAYTNALVILTEQMIFPDASGIERELPDPFKARKE